MAERFATPSKLSCHDGDSAWERWAANTPDDVATREMSRTAVRIIILPFRFAGTLPVIAQCGSSISAIKLIVFVISIDSIDEFTPSEIWLCWSRSKDNKVTNANAEGVAY